MTDNKAALDALNDIYYHIAGGPPYDMGWLSDRAQLAAEEAADPTIAADLALTAAVERLEDSNISIIERDPSDGKWCISGDGSDESHWHATLTAAIEEALRDD
jgi:hypothetical protein